MARISSYTKDTNISSNDKLLGSDASGATRNFVINDIQSFIAETNTAGSSSSFTYKYSNGDTGSGEATFTVSSGSTFYGYPLKWCYIKHVL